MYFYNKGNVEVLSITGGTLELTTHSSRMIVVKCRKSYLLLEVHLNTAEGFNKRGIIVEVLSITGGTLELCSGQITNFKKIVEVLSITGGTLEQDLCH